MLQGTVQFAEVWPCRQASLAATWHQELLLLLLPTQGALHHGTAGSLEELQCPLAGTTGGHFAAKPCSCLSIILQTPMQSQLHVLMPFWRKVALLAAQTACAGLICDDRAVHAHLKWNCTCIRHRALSQPPRCHTLEA